ncbi:MAG: thioredoxin domain-containing protein [Firmicutes bacterium]|nr:thioredoxin domain-containing protein [Bacillota bacterium]
MSSETSPYLRQHAADPVDWQPWNDETLKLAREMQRPILLSIGYSACHWCHVMQRESFQNQEIAELMNKHFIPIKVDREERPDLDHIYQRASVLLTGHGGWPLTVFITPEAKPFFAGTYFPPQDRFGRTGFAAILQQIARLWEKERDAVEKAADEVTAAMAEELMPAGAQEFVPLRDELISQDWAARLLEDAENYLLEFYDERNGGFGTAPKFPSTGILKFFLQRSRQAPILLEVVINTLNHMAGGGIYDQLGGGFHRYSTDDRWLIPHFEKMLYDNAMLVQVYVTAYQLTGDLRYRQIAEETLDYLLRDMWYPCGAFFGTEDADSEGEEGKFYLWTRQEVIELLGEEMGDVVCAYYGIGRADSLVDGASVLHRVVSLDALAEQLDMSIHEVDSILQSARLSLYQRREQRVRPARDEKIITAWNGMAVSALAKAGSVLQVPMYVEKARAVASFGLTRLRRPDGRLCRSFKGVPSSIPGFLEDYGYFVAGLVDLFKATLEPFWLDAGLNLMELAVQLFWSDSSRTFYDTEPGDNLLFRPSIPEDESYPSAVSIMAQNLFYLQNLLSCRAEEKLELLLNRHVEDMRRNPWGFAGLLTVLDLAQRGLREFFVIEPAQGGAEPEILNLLQTAYLPEGIIYRGNAAPYQQGRFHELGMGKTAVEGKTTVYICEGQTCYPPITDPAALRARIQNSSLDAKKDPVLPVL